MELELHPLCTLFPRLAGAEFEALKVDIETNGLQQSITIYNGMILDGGNRYRACIELGIEPTFVNYEGDDPLAVALSCNLHRRHLSPGQFAVIVSTATDWLEAYAPGGDRKSDQSATVHLDSVADRAARSGASIRTQKRADKVAKANPDLAKKVAHGEVTLPEALRQVEGKGKPVRSEKLDSHSQVNEESLQNDYGPSAEEIVFAEEWQAAQQRAFDTISALADEDDKLAAALRQVSLLEDEVARLKAAARVQQERINGLMNEKNEAIRFAQSWRRKAEKALKESA
ncbi:MAG: ParB/RepB/Spo0J family partition protein [Burkholderia gladioli]